MQTFTHLSHVPTLIVEGEGSVVAVNAATAAAAQRFQGSEAEQIKTFDLL